jgi:uncharacterized damage-inducible protein DinB
MTDFSKKQFKFLFAYTWHTTLRLLDCAQRLSAAETQENPGYGHGSIHDVFFHMLRGANSWRVALESGKQQRGLRAESYPDLAAIRAGLVEEQQAWLAMLDGLSPDQIEGDVNLTNYRGESSDTPRWLVLQHIVLHSMQHHADLAQLLTARGQSPGDIDLIFYDPAA